MNSDFKLERPVGTSAELAPARGSSLQSPRNVRGCCAIQQSQTCRQSASGGRARRTDGSLFRNERQASPPCSFAGSHRNPPFPLNPCPRPPTQTPILRLTLSPTTHPPS